MLGIIFVVVFLAAIAVAVVVVYRTMKTTDIKAVDKTLNDKIEFAQEFLPFKDVKGFQVIAGNRNSAIVGVIDLGMHQYRGIIECTSTNYQLKTDVERDRIEILFQQFLNSLTHPVEFFVQTRYIDNSEMLNTLHEDLLRAVERYPQLDDYAESYYECMTSLNDYIGNHIQKHKYIIVPYDDAINNTSMTDEEKANCGMMELYNRMDLICKGMSNMDIIATPLSLEKIIELVYSTYHKEDYKNFRSVADGKNFTEFVDGADKKLLKLPSESKIDLILYETENKIKSELEGKDLDESLIYEYKNTIQAIEKMRGQFSSYFNKDDKDLEYKKRIQSMLNKRRQEKTTVDNSDSQ